MLRSSRDHVRGNFARDVNRLTPLWRGWRDAILGAVVLAALLLTLFLWKGMMP